MRFDTRRLATSLVILPSLLVFFACEPDPLTVDTSTLSYAKGGNGGGKDKDPEGRRDISFGLYKVALVWNSEGSLRGFTSNPEVNDAVYEYLLTDPEMTYEFIANGNLPVELPGGPEAYFGCPDVHQPCSEVTLHFAGSAFTLYGSIANMVVGCGLDGLDHEYGCMNDFGLVNRRWASTAGGSAFPSIPWELLADAIVTDETTGESIFTYYWQGQRGIRHRKVTGTEKRRGRIRTTYAYTELWDYLPDLHTVGTPETPIFGFGSRTSSLSGNTYFTNWGSYRREDNCTPDADDCRGQYQGAPGAGPLYMWIDLWELDNQGRLEFAIQAFTEDPGELLAPGASTLDYTSQAVLDANPLSHSRVMMVPPGGPRTMLSASNSGRRVSGYSYKVGVAESQYILDLTEAGCYEFHALSLVTKEFAWGQQWEDTFLVNRLVWTPDPDPDTRVFHVVNEGQNSSMAMGSCPAPLP